LTFHYTILLRHVRGRAFALNTLRTEILQELFAPIFSPAITPECLYLSTRKLLCSSLKFEEKTKDFRLPFHEVTGNKSHKLIGEQHEICLSTDRFRFDRSAHIAVYPLQYFRRWVLWGGK